MTVRILFASAVSLGLATLFAASCVDNSDCTRTATCPSDGGGGAGTGAIGGGPTVGGGGASSTGAGGVGGGNLLALGESCSSGEECVSTLCVDGVCCDGACDGVCETCATGVCIPSDPGTDPDTDCGSGTCTSLQECAAGAHVWSQSHGGAGTELPGALELDPTGNIVISGMFDGTANFGGNALVGDLYGVFVAKYTAGGQHLWSKAWDTDVFKTAAVCADPVGNLFLAGEFKGAKSFGGGVLDSGSTIYENIFLVKLDSSGNHVWSKQFGTPNVFDDFRTVACDASGNVILTGDADASHDVGATLQLPPGNFMVKFDPAGNHVFSEQFGGQFSGGLSGAAAIGTDVLVTGNVTQGPYDLGGLTINDGRYLARLSATGNGIWVVPGVGGRLATLGTDRIAVTGSSTIPIDLGGGELPAGGFLAVYDGDGNHIWSRGGWGANPDALDLDPDGNVAFTGDFTDSVDYGTGSLTPLGKDAFLVKLDGATGATLWVQQFGTIDEESGWHVQASDVNVFAVGQFSNAIDLGGGSLTNGAQTGIWLAAFEP